MIMQDDLCGDYRLMDMVLDRRDKKRIAELYKMGSDLFKTEPGFDIKYEYGVVHMHNISFISDTTG